MKASLLVLSLIVSSLAFGQGNSTGTGNHLVEQQKFKTVTGKFVKNANCVEGYALITKRKKVVCLGFASTDLTEKDLRIGKTYSLGGYESEDGFYATEFSH